MRKNSNLYVKYIIKSPVFFALFILVGVILFLYLSLSLKINIADNVDTNVINNQVIIDGEYNLKSSIIYLYNNKNEKVYLFDIEDILINNGKTIIVIDNINNLSGEFQADIITGSQSLFERIFLRETISNE